MRVIIPIVILKFTKLIVEVRKDGIYVKYVPFHFKYKRIFFSEIKDVENLIYRPIRGFGGWGIRFNFKGERAYTVDGN